MIKQLDTSIMMCNFNSDMIMSIVSNGSNLSIAGNFRTNADFGAMIYYTEDTWSNFQVKYKTIRDLSTIILDYDFTTDGLTNMDDELLAPSLTIHSVDGTDHYIRLANYTTNNHVHLDFSNIKEGWEGTTKVDMTQVIYIMWGFSPINGLPSIDEHTPDKVKPLEKSTPFHMNITNWTVTGAQDLGDYPQNEAHKYQLADGYDDNYNVTPERFIEHFYSLGFRGYIDMYIGASHFFDKERSGDTFVQSKTFKLNEGARTWLEALFKCAAKRSYKIIASISMESLSSPLEWRQIAYDGTESATGWEPPTHLLSFTNPEVLSYFKAYAITLARMQTDAGIPPIIQLGEPWWWNQKEKPCFYDKATKELFRAEMGRDIPIYETMWNENFDHEMMKWLADKIGIFTQNLRNTLKTVYPATQFGILWFPPTILDNTVVGKMMSEANTPIEQWSYPTLDFFEIEDYDWLIDQKTDKHYSTYTLPKKLFNYDAKATHYFGGFVLKHEDFDTSPLWKRIMRAVHKGLRAGFYSFIWAGAQIRRDGWHIKTSFIKINNISLDKISDLVVCKAKNEMPDMSLINTTPLDE